MLLLKIIYIWAILNPHLLPKWDGIRSKVFSALPPGTLTKLSQNSCLLTESACGAVVYPPAAFSGVGNTVHGCTVQPIHTSAVVLLHKHDNNSFQFVRYLWRAEPCLSTLRWKWSRIGGKVAQAAKRLQSGAEDSSHVTILVQLTASILQIFCNTPIKKVGMIIAIFYPRKKFLRPRLE